MKTFFEMFVDVRFTSVLYQYSMNVLLTSTRGNETTDIQRQIDTKKNNKNYVIRLVFIVPLYYRNRDKSRRLCLKRHIFSCHTCV